MILLGLFQLRLFCDSDFLALPTQGVDPKKAQTIGLHWPTLSVNCVPDTRLDLPSVFITNNQATSAWAPQPQHGDTGVFNSAWAGQGWSLQA